MPYYYIRNTGTAIEAVGLVINDGYKAKDIYFASFTGPAEASKAVWAAAVGSEKTSVIKNSWKDGKLMRPHKRYSVKLPGTNYVHYVMRTDDPHFFMTTHPILNQLDVRTKVTAASNGGTSLQDHAADLLPEWKDPHTGSSYYNYTNIATVREWLREQPKNKAELAKKLVIALNRVTKVPVLPEWGPTLLEKLPADAIETLSCYGDALNAYLLAPDYDYSAWITRLMRQGTISIPQPKEQ